MTFLLCFLAFLAGALTTTWAWSLVVLTNNLKAQKGR